ncbi:MAG: NUDIX hydrolase [Syntrophomonadaceae bacterium]|nr:NUDIX hydrolase [Syntrophomonadaceae bacterium]
MEQREIKIDSQEIYDGRILRLRVDEVELPNGRAGRREVVEHGEAVAVVALDESQNIILIRQYRYATGQQLLEIPAGLMEAGEEPLAAAQRELEEETGLCAKHWEQLSCFYSSPGFCDERIYLYLATGLYPGQENPDEDEFIETVSFPLSRAAQMMQAGDLYDGKTITGIALAALRYLPR